MRQLSAEEKEEYAADARALLASPAIVFVFEQLREEYLAQLIPAEVGSLTAATAHGSMKVLADVKRRLESFEIDRQMAATGGRRIR